ncbi:MAG: alpha/beta hydrolase [Candidatus Lokiarchaeota archaeon]|nr:alpha/beta hydrolase [Candidatus Lokiarchaeota archaeon]
MPYVELDKGYKIHFLEKGKGKNLVFIHGFLGSAWLFEAQIDYFSSNFRTIAIDHLGHGKSDKPDSESYELTDLAEYLEETLSKIIGDEKIILVGHSMGGMISLIYATNPKLAKRLEGLILMSTAPKLNNPGLVQYVEDLKSGAMSLKDRETIENIFVGLCFQRKARKEQTELIKEFVDLTLQNEEYVGLRTMESIVNNFNVEDKLKSINIPTLILAGDKDIFILPTESESMNKLIPNSTLSVLTPKIGHMIQYEAPEQYTAAIENFLKNI